MAATEDIADRITMDAECITIQVNPVHPYEILLSRCDTPEKMLSWVYHLTEKTWMNARGIRKFMDLAAKHHGFDLHLDC